MKIGIAAPILIRPLLQFLPDNLSCPLPAGMGAPAINSLVEGLMASGHSVSVYTLDESVDEPITLASERFSLYVGRFGSSAKIRALSLFKREAHQIREFIRQDRPDIVNAHWSCEYGRAAAQSSFPHVISLRDHSWTILKLQQDYYRLFRYLTDVWVRAQGRHFTVNSPHLRRMFSPWKKNLSVLPNSISAAYIRHRPKQLRPDRIKIISVLTGWSKLKNPFPALEAFSLVRRKMGIKMTYHLYGPGYQSNGVGAAWARKRGLDKDVEFKGPIPHDRLMERMQSYDLLVHPSIEESFGNTLIEGMAAGLPVIGGRRSGAVPWVLNHGTNGILTDVSSSIAIASSIIGLLENPKRYEHLSHTGIEYVLKRFSPAPVAKQYIRLYETILGQRDPESFQGTDP